MTTLTLHVIIILSVKKLTAFSLFHVAQPLLMEALNAVQFYKFTFACAKARFDVQY